MKLTGGQLFSIFIVVIMVGSIVSVFTFGDNQSQTPPSTVPPASDATTAVTYGAYGVAAEVVQVFPTAILIGTTDAENTNTVDNEIRKVTGITLVSNSQFLDSSIGTSSNFRTELRFSSIDKIQKAVDAIKNIPILSNVQILRQALVSVPPNIELNNSDIDLTQNYSFPKSQLQSFILEGTEVGDDLKITIQAQFKGQNIAGVLAFEEEEQISAYRTVGIYKISSLEDEFFVRSSANLSDSQKLESAKGEILAASGDLNSDLKVVQASAATVIKFANPDNIFENDLNTFFSGFIGVKSFAFHLDQNYMVLEFDGSGDYPEFRDSLRRELDALGFGVDSIAEPMVSMQGNVSPKIGKEEFLKAVAAAEKKESIKIEALQKAAFDANSIMLPDINASFAVNEGHFNAFVKPTHAVGDDVHLTILVFGTQRLGAVQIEAQEADPGAQIITTQ